MLCKFEFVNILCVRARACLCVYIWVDGPL